MAEFTSYKQMPPALQYHTLLCSHRSTLIKKQHRPNPYLPCCCTRDEGQQRQAPSELFKATQTEGQRLGHSWNRSTARLEDKCEPVPNYILPPRNTLTAIVTGRMHKPIRRCTGYERSKSGITSISLHSSSPLLFFLSPKTSD